MLIKKTQENALLLSKAYIWCLYKRRRIYRSYL